MYPKMIVLTVAIGALCACGSNHVPPSLEDEPTAGIDANASDTDGADRSTTEVSNHAPDITSPEYVQPLEAAPDVVNVNGSAISSEIPTPGNEKGNGAPQAFATPGTQPSPEAGTATH